MILRVHSSSVAGAWKEWIDLVSYYAWGILLAILLLSWAWSTLTTWPHCCSNISTAFIFQGGREPVLTNTCYLGHLVRENTTIQTNLLEIVLLLAWYMINHKTAYMILFIIQFSDTGIHWLENMLNVLKPESKHQ